MDTAKVIEVIETTITRRGDGVTTPVRVITEYWSKDGIKLAEVDPCCINYTLNKAEQRALKQAQKLLEEFCGRNNDYDCCEGKVNIIELFKKVVY